MNRLTSLLWLWLVAVLALTACAGPAAPVDPTAVPSAEPSSASSAPVVAVEPPPPQASSPASPPPVREDLVRHVCNLNVDAIHARARPHGPSVATLASGDRVEIVDRSQAPDPNAFVWERENHVEVLLPDHPEVTGPVWVVNTLIGERGCEPVTAPRYDFASRWVCSAETGAVLEDGRYETLDRGEQVEQVVGAAPEGWDLIRAPGIEGTAQVLGEDLGLYNSCLEEGEP